MGIIAVWRKLRKDWAGRRTGPNDRRNSSGVPARDERRRGPDDRRTDDRRRRPEPSHEELA